MRSEFVSTHEVWALEMNLSIIRLQLTYPGNVLLPCPPSLLLHPRLFPFLARPSLACRRCPRLRLGLLRIGSSSCVPSCLEGAEPVHWKWQLGSVRHPELRLSDHCTAPKLVGNVTSLRSKSCELERSESIEDECWCRNPDNRHILGFSCVGRIYMRMAADEIWRRWHQCGIPRLDQSALLRRD